jgi:zeaxanthin glucosyltransferase
MAHFAIISPEEAGHLLPIGAVGAELASRGHRVTVLARPKAAPLAKQLGLPLHELQVDDVPWPKAYLLWQAFQLYGAGWMIGMRGGFQWNAEAVLSKVPQILKELAVDGVLVDQNILAGGSASERAGLPFVTVCSALLWHEEVGLPPPFTHWDYARGPLARWRNRLGYAAWHWYMRPTMKVINRYRRAWRLPPVRRVDKAFSPLAQISQLCPEFDFPRRELPPHFHYVGSLAADRRPNTDHDFPWDRLDGRPLIFASLGTIPDPTNPPVFRKILAACGGLDAQLVLALGKWQDGENSVRTGLGPVPDNAMVIDFAPQMALLDKAALLITHAGSNTVVEALCRGVPMVALPRSADQTGMGSRVAYAGVGLRASFYRTTPEELRELVKRVLTDDVIRQRARKLQQAMLAAGGARRAADVAEEALTTRRPVT